MFFTHLPDMPDNMSDTDIEQANSWLKTNVETEMWTTSVVCARFTLSAARLNQMHKSYKIPGHIQLGSTHLYIAKFAGPWFTSYEAKAKARINAKERKKEKGPARRKGKATTYTLWGIEYAMPENVGQEYDNWLGYIASQYPDYFENGEFKKVIGSLITSQPQQLKDALKEVHTVFRKLKASKL